MLVAALATLSACKKDKGGENLLYEKADAFFARHAVPTQTFTGDAATGFTITGEKGTKIVFPANAFVKGDGNYATGTVTVTLKEILSKKDVMFSGVMTESNGQLLESGGELEVKARQGDAALNMQPDAQIAVEVPKVMNDVDMGLFVQEKRERPQGGNDSPYESPFTWVPAPYAPFGNGPNSYSFNLPGFTWVNCDRFYSDARPKTTITVLPDFQDDNAVSDLQVMLVFRDIVTVITLPYDFTANKFQSYYNSLPVGLQADLVIIGKDSEGYIQFGSQLITISANMHVDCPVKRSTQAEVDAFLSSVQ